MAVEGIFSVLRSTMNGLSMQMKRMNAISENIANAERSPDANNNVYKKQVVVNTNRNRGTHGSFADHFRLRMRGSRTGHIIGNGTTQSGAARRQEAESRFETREIEQTKLVYNPAHPQADENGYIRLPDISVVEEMVDLVSASRSYEANISVMTAAKQMAKRALNI